MKTAVVELFATHPLISDRARLAIMATLASSKSAIEFKVLLKALNLTREIFPRT